VGDEPIDPGAVELAGRVFDLARNGSTGDLAGYLDSGVPGDLTNSARGTPSSSSRRTTTTRQSTGTVTRLTEAGADPDAGGPSARATAAFVQLSGMTELLEGAADRPAHARTGEG
jgi:hypothetical protein